MIGFGFAYRQATGIVGAKQIYIDSQVAINLQIENEAPAEAVTVQETDEKIEIAKAISECRSSLEADDVASLASIIRDESKKYNYDWELILAIIRTESQFDARARSNKGARGLMQVLPSTAKWLSPKMGLKYKGHDFLYDPEYNIKLGAHYLHMMHERFGDMGKAIAAYNRGPTGLTRYLRQGRKYPPMYLTKVMGYYKELKSSPDEFSG